jgi:L-fuculose-phosphate aldolase
MLEETTFAAFRDIGKDLFLRGLVSSHAGNMSVRTAEGIYITRTKSMLGRITRDDLIDVDAAEPGPRDNRASSELTVHRAIYRAGGAGAVVHAHPPYATLLSMLQNELVPIDWEGCYLLQKVPVEGIDRTMFVDLPESAHVISEALKKHKIIMLKGHGSFARGDSLEEAYMLTTTLEASSFYLYHLRER